MSKERTRCSGCQAPIQLLPGAGSRLCPFCGYINLVREQRLAVPSLELKTDEVFHKIQKGNLKGALSLAESMLDPQAQSVRLAYYRACVLLGLEEVTEAVYAFIDITGLDLTESKWNKLFSINKSEWLEEAKEQRKFLDRFGKKLPKELTAEHSAFLKRLKKHK